MRAKDLLIFTAGIAVGATAAWKLLRDRYALLAQEEIDSVKEALSRKEQEELPMDEEEAKQKAMAAKEKPDITEYVSKVKDMGYVDYSDISKNKNDNTEEDSQTVDKPYVITPDEFDEYDDYDTIELTYYSDQVLADENNEIVDDVEDIVGFESLNHFGEYEDDSVFVRNDRLKCDYQILLDSRKYSDVAKSMPRYSMEE